MCTVSFELIRNGRHGNFSGHASDSCGLFATAVSSNGHLGHVRMLSYQL